MLHHLQDLVHRGLAKGFGDLDLQQPALVDAAAKGFVPRAQIPGQGFAGKGAGIQGAFPLGDHPVQGHPFPRGHQDGFAYLHLLRRYLLGLPIPHHTGHIRPDVHQLCDGGPGTAHRVAFKQAPDLVK